jgi:hypothetical protein
LYGVFVEYMGMEDRDSGNAPRRLQLSPSNQQLVNQVAYQKKFSLQKYSSEKNISMAVKNRFSMPVNALAKVTNNVPTRRMVRSKSEPCFGTFFIRPDVDVQKFIPKIVIPGTTRSILYANMRNDPIIIVNIL